MVEFHMLYSELNAQVIVPPPHILYFGSKHFSLFSQRHFTLCHFALFLWSPFLVLRQTQYNVAALSDLLAEEHKCYFKQLQVKRVHIGIVVIPF